MSLVDPDSAVKAREKSRVLVYTLILDPLRSWSQNP